MNRLSPHQQERVIHLLLEGCSIRSAHRLTGVHRDTIARLLIRTGRHCESLMSTRIRGVRSVLLEVDEAWTYVGKKDKRLCPTDASELGSQWIFIARCRDTRLVPAFAVGKRTTAVARRLMETLGARLAARPRIVTDALEAYKEAVEGSFGSAVDYTVMTKEFGNGTSWVKPVRVQGEIPGELVSTSLIERQNLTLRNFVRRLARKTLCFSKKLDHLKAALSIHFCYYNFGRIHGTLGVTPAMEAGLANSVWGVADLLPDC